MFKYVKKRDTVPLDVWSATQKSWSWLGSEAIAWEEASARRASSRILAAISLQLEGFSQGNRSCGCGCGCGWIGMAKRDRYI